MSMPSRIGLFVAAALIASVPAAAQMEGSGYRTLGAGAASQRLPGQLMQGGARLETRCALNGALVPLASCIPASGATVQIDPDYGSVQYLENNAAFTLKAPAYEGSVLLIVYAGGSAGTITFSGFSNTNTGASPSTTATNSISIWYAAPLGGNAYAGYIINN